MAERMFTVIVPRPGQQALVYPDQPGDKALENMTVLKSRGHDPIARTTANGITEDLSLEDMKLIYAGVEDGVPVHAPLDLAYERQRG